MTKSSRRRKSRWMNRATSSMKKRGTRGSFTAYCKRLGFSGVTSECIRRGLKSKDPGIRKKAAFAKAAKTVARRRKS